MNNSIHLRKGIFIFCVKKIFLTLSVHSSCESYGHVCVVCDCLILLLNATFKDLLPNLQTVFELDIRLATATNATITW